MRISDFEKYESVGDGTYGTVYRALNTITREEIALKKVHTSSDTEGIPATTIREIIILKNLKHPNIIELQEVLTDDNNDMYLVFEFINKDLRKLINICIKTKKFLGIEIVMSLGRQLTSAIACCHNRCVFHRDIKPQNILIKDDYIVKLADFGLARNATIPLRKYTPNIVTLWYRAPELLLGAEYYDAFVDIWSLGCIIYEIYTLEVLFPGDCEIDQLKQIYKILGTPESSDWPGLEELPKYKKTTPIKKRGLGLENILLEDLLLKMLQYNPLNRITAEEALNHPFFSGSKENYNNE